MRGALRAWGKGGVGKPVPQVLECCGRSCLPGRAWAAQTAGRGLRVTHAMGVSPSKCARPRGQQTGIRHRRATHECGRKHL